MRTPTADTVFVFLVVWLDLLKLEKKARRDLDTVITYSCLNT